MVDETVRSIAERLVGYCREGKERQGLQELYAPDAVSVEATPMGGADSAEAVGVAAIQAKHDWWDNAFEIHSSSVEGPYFHGADRFGAIFELDATEKATNERMPMKEFGVYTVKDGKIVREEFFYTV